MPKVLVGKLKERNHLENLGLNAKIMSKRILKDQDGSVWSASIWLRIGTGGELLCIRQ
jgi:hypothetical protein